MRVDKYDDVFTGIFNGVLDKVSNAVFAISNRLLTRKYSGALIRARVSATEKDVYKNNQNYLSKYSLVEGGGNLETFAGANPIFIPRAYDQSGNGFNATQTTASIQFNLRLSAFLSKSSFFGDVSKDSTLTTGNLLDNFLFGSDKKFSFSFVVKTPIDINTTNFNVFNAFTTPAGVHRGFGIFYGFTGGNQYVYGFAGDGVNSFRFNSNSTIAVNSTAYITITYDGAIDTSRADRLKIYINGIDTGFSISSFTGAFPFDLALPLATTRILHSLSGYSVNLAELIIFNKVLSLSEVTTVYNNQLLAYGT